MAESNFSKALVIVLKHEGGYGNDPYDSGGPTNFGITQHDLSVYLGHSASADEVRHMTEAVAASIYEKNYWMPYHLDSLTSFKVAAVIFDQGVLSGPHTAIKIAQQACGAVQDGVMGFKTLTALNAGEPVKTANRILDLCASHYQAIVAHNPTQNRFLKGWLNRVASLRAFVDA